MTTKTTTAKIATLGVLDLDRDITLDGWFVDGMTAPVVPTHDWSSVPLGRATVRVVDDEVLADIEWNDTREAESWRQAIEFDYARQPHMNWSYGFTIRDGSTSVGTWLDELPARFLGAAPDGSPGCNLIEVSPVMRGAGVGTTTLAIGDSEQATDDEMAGIADLMAGEFARFVANATDLGDAAA